jgi:autotransporter-associated beta strand protein
VRCAALLAGAVSVLCFTNRAAFAVVMPNINLTLATPSSSYNTLNMTVDLASTAFGVGSQGQSATPTVTGACSVTLNALFNPTTYQATVPSITFNQQQPGQISLQSTTLNYSWNLILTKFTEKLTTSSGTTNVLMTPGYTGSQAPPTPVSGGLFAGNQMSMIFNGGAFNYSGGWTDTWNFASSPENFTNGTTSSGTLAISAPTMNGNVATYTATVTLPLALNGSFSKTLYSTQVVTTGTLKASGTFTFDFGPRTVYWNAASGDLSAGGNWDVGFAPRTGDTAAIQNGGTSTLSTAFAAIPAAVWVGNGATTSGTLTVAAGGSLSCGAMVLGQSGGTGTLVLGGGTLSAPSIVAGTGGTSSLYFDAGTLQATTGNAQFLAGLGGAYVRAGGATINSNGYAVTINQALQHDPALGATPDGGLLKTGAGTLTLSAANTYTGGTTISAGALQLGDGSANNGSVQGNISNQSALMFANPSPQTYAGNISGGGSVTVAGPSTLTLSGTGTYSGPTAVQGGKLVVAGSLGNTAVSVAGGAALGGAGSIAGSLLVSGGSSPATQGTIDLVDGAIDRLTLNDPNSADTVLTLGGLTPGNPSMLNFEVGAAADSIHVTAGKVVVNPGGGMVNITALEGLVPGTYDLIDFVSDQATGLENLSLATASIDGYVAHLQATRTAEELVVAVVPEPSTLTFLGAGVISLAAFGWWRRRTA